MTVSYIISLVHVTNLRSFLGGTKLIECLLEAFQKVKCFLLACENGKTNSFALESDNILLFHLYTPRTCDPLCDVRK